MSLRIWLVAFTGFFLATSSGFTQEKEPPAQKTKQQLANEKLLKDVFEKLLAVATPVPEGFLWPPNCAIIYEGDINAYATWEETKDGKRQPILRVYEGIMNKVVEGDADRLALILGHEFGHILKGHTMAKPSRDKTPFLKSLFTRQQEDEADKTGWELMVKAGFSFQKGVVGFSRMLDLGLGYSSFEGLGTDHPSWNDRLKKVDVEKSHLWKVSSAFTNGVFFLSTEQYLYAASCFEFVTKEFPDCYEAYANLGYAYLMQYCDKLDKKDLEKYGIGQIIVGGFYTRWNQKTREMDIKMWQNAVAALRESDKKKPNQMLVLGNLGLAYLVHPDGKNVAEATKYLNLAVEAAKEDKNLDPMAYAALMINLGVANLAGAAPDKALAQIDETEKTVRNLAEKQLGKRMIPSYNAALQYNKALVLAARPEKADQEMALGILEKYLETTSPLTLWWDIAFDKYSKLSTILGKAAKPADKLKKARTISLRLVTGVKLKSGAELTLGEEKDGLEKKLGKGNTVQVAKGQPLWRMRYENLGVELLADADDLLAITLIGPDAPAIPIKGSGIGAETLGEVKVGQTIAEIEKILGEECQTCEITAADVFYRYYREQGLAVRIQKGKVTEVVIVQLPRAAQVGK